MSKDFTLQDMEKLLDKKLKGTTETILKRIDERFQESKDYTDSRFNWLATQMMQEFERADRKMESFRLETKEEFYRVHQKIDMLAANTNVRLELLEERVP
jgi:hypothetical protein